MNVGTYLPNLRMNTHLDNFLVDPSQALACDMSTEQFIINGSSSI